MLISRSLSPIARRPYWLLLALALFLAGQLAISQHWHDASSAAVDYDCALCVLSGVSGAAAIASGWQAIAVPLCVFSTLYFFLVYRRCAIRFNDSRAPPSLLIQNV
jgi:hypothetical protein